MRIQHSLIFAFWLSLGLCDIPVFGQEINSFEQLGTILPTPNSTRSASGSPGKAYWQQKADYAMDIHLDDTKQKAEKYAA